VKLLNTNKLTRYERARIIGARALQISMGAPVLLEDDSGEPIDIAFRELERGVIPVTIKRLTEVKTA
jgi:DNA-directed RNA polymerase subunit K